MSWPTARLLVGICVVIVCTAACRVEVGSDVSVRRDGGGSITVTVTADDAVRDALARGGLGDFGQALFGAGADRELPSGAGGGDAFADLRAAGWQVDAVAGGVRIQRDFAAGEDLEPVLAGLGGDDPSLSPVPSLSVVHQGGFPRERVEVSGHAGLSSDAVARLATQTGSDSPTAEEMEDVLGASLTDLVTVRFHLDLPGSVDSVDADPAPAAPDDLTWNLPGGRTLDFAAKSSYWSSFVTRTLMVLLVLAVAAVAFVVWRRSVVVRRRRARASAASDARARRRASSGRRPAPTPARRASAAPARRPPTPRRR